MITYKDPYYIVNGDMSSDIVGPWINACGFNIVVFQAAWSAVGSTGGRFYVEGTYDPASGLYVELQMPPDPPTSSSSAAMTIVTTGYISSYYDGAYHPTGLPLPEFVRLRYIRDSGGAANQLQVQVIGRQ